MFFVGIQEERERGLWVSILSMDRMQVVKKYSAKAMYFHSCPGLSELGEFLRDLQRDMTLFTRKKQFSQLGRPPKYVQVPPRILLRPEEGRLREDLLKMLEVLPVQAPFLCLDGQHISGKIPCERLAGDLLLPLVHRVYDEKRLILETPPSDMAEPALFSTGLALWGGEKIWRLVRYGG